MHSLTEANMKVKLQRQEQPVKIVTFCVKGTPSKNLHDNKSREELYKIGIDKIKQKGWKNLDAVLLPGQYFWLDGQVGQLSFDQRSLAISHTSFYTVCIDECTKLEVSSPGIMIVVGIDTKTDDLCVALSSKGIEGIGHKIFPAPDEASTYICYEEDYSTDMRIVTLPCGQNSVLCACYDMFGCAETPSEPTQRTKNICNLSNGITVFKVGHTKQSSCVDKFQQLLTRHNVTVGMAAIHGFDKPGRDVMWQRHGIASCSAAIGGLAIGAAHFSKCLPNLYNSPLAAGGVARNHLSLGHHRKANQLQPSDGFQIDDSLLGRLFEW